MSFPSNTTGLGVAAKVLTTGNVNFGNTKPGKNNVVLSLSGTLYPTTFQLTPEIVDVANNPVAPGTALVLTAVAADVLAPYTLTAVATSVNGYAVYTGTITGGGSNAFAGREFTIAGFTGATNNGNFECSASTATTITLFNGAAVAETHAATAQDDTAVAVYTGTITGGGSNAFAGQDFVIAGFTNAPNNGTFTATASSTTTLTLSNTAAVAETHAATATPEDAGSDVLKYVSYGFKTLTGNTWQPSGTQTAVATISSAGVITAVALGSTVVEVSYPTFANTVGNVVSSGNVMNGLPINKVYSEFGVRVVP